MNYQLEVDALVERIKALAAKCGGQSDAMAEVRQWYAAFTRCPEAGAFVALEAAVAKVEAETERFRNMAELDRLYAEDLEARKTEVPIEGLTGAGP